MFRFWGCCYWDYEGKIGFLADVWETGIFCSGYFFYYFFGYDDPPNPNNWANTFCFCYGTGGFYTAFYCFTCWCDGFYIEFYKIYIGFCGWLVFVSLLGWSFLTNLELYKTFLCYSLSFFLSFYFSIVYCIYFYLSYLFFVFFNPFPPLEKPPYVRICCSAFWMISNYFSWAILYWTE